MMHFLLIALFSIFLLATKTLGNPDGAPNGYAGNPPNYRSCVQCHTTYPVNSGNGSMTLSGLPAGGYQSNTTYHLTLTLQDPGQSRWGFELTPIYQSSGSYLQAGNMTVTQSTYTQQSLGTGTVPDYLKQTETGTFAGNAGPVNWQFDWTAPNTATGPITFYIAGNAANNNGGISGDYIYTITSVVNPFIPPQPPVVGDIPGQTIPCNGVAQFDDIALDNYVSDPDTPDSLITWAVSGNTAINVEIINRIASFELPMGLPLWFGSETLTFTATDPNNLSDSDIAVFTVENNPPSVSDIPDVNFNTNAGMTSPIVLDNYVTDPESPAGDLNWSFSGNQTNITVSILNHVLTFTQNFANWYGSGSFWLIASDLGALSDSDMVTVTINNLAPVLQGIPDQTIYAGEDFTVIDMASYCNDPNHSMMEMDWSVSGNIDLTVEFMGAMATVTPPDSDWTGSEELIFTVTDPGGLSDSDTAMFTVIQSGVPYLANPEIPTEFVLKQNYPNPFNNSTTISFDLPNSAYLNLALYDIGGRIARNLASDYLEAGNYRIEVDLTELPSGIYFYAVNAGNFHAMRKLVLVK